MSIFSRLIRLFKADLHGVMDWLEDRDLLLKQYLREMGDALADNRAHLSNRQVRKEQIAGAQAACHEKIGVLEADIALAVDRHKDDIARLLIRKLLPLRQDAEAREGALGHLAEEIQTLQDTCERQARDYARLRRRAAMAVASHGPDGRARASASIAANLGPSTPSAEEIELELLQRKEAQRAGRTR